MIIYQGGMSFKGRELLIAYNKKHNNEMIAYRDAFKIELLVNTYYADLLIKEINSKNSRCKNLDTLEHWADKNVKNPVFRYDMNPDKEVADKFNMIMTYISQDVSKTTMCDVLNICYEFSTSIIKSAITQCRDAMATHPSYIRTICEDIRAKEQARKDFAKRMEAEKSKTDEKLNEEKNTVSVFEAMSIASSWDSMINEDNNSVNWGDIGE